MNLIAIMVQDSVILCTGQIRVRLLLCRLLRLQLLQMNICTILFLVHLQPAVPNKASRRKGFFYTKIRI